MVHVEVHALIRAFAACPAELAHVFKKEANFGGVMVACWVLFVNLESIQFRNVLIF